MKANQFVPGYVSQAVKVESSFTDYELAVMEGGLSLDKPVSALHQAVSIVEAFDKPYEILRWEKGDFGDVDAIARLDDNTFLSIMFNKGVSKDSKEETWSVEFYRNNSQEVTGEGDAQRVFATVISAMQTFIKKYKPNRIIFTASKEVEQGQNAQSRARLYDSLVQRYARSWGFRAFRADTGNKVIYELNRINKGLAEGKLIESAVFLNPTTVIVGQAHGQPLELSPNTLKQIQAIAAKHGAYYEGNGTDRAYTKGQIDRYVGSWDDEVAKTASPNDPKWLYVLFANVDANNRVQRVGVDPKDTIFNRLLATAKDNSFQGIGYTSQALQKFLQMASEGKYDFVKMSQQPATQENLTRFLKAGEALMWPNNWEQYPNKAGKIAKAATVDVRDQYLATRKAGVYVTGSGHLKAVQNITGKQGVAENFADGQVKGKSRPGRVKRSGASCDGSVTDLRSKAKDASGERAKMYHWCANMKSGRAKTESEILEDLNVIWKDVLEAGVYKGYPCTKDCSGHAAGDRWADARDITDPNQCPYSNNSFWEGCLAHTDEQE